MRLPVQLLSVGRSNRAARALAMRAIADPVASLITHDLFGRLPDLRVLSVENGCEWVHPLVKKLDRHARICGEALVRLLGGEAVIAGSDCPHPEGLPESTAFAHKLTGLDDADVRKVMCYNAAALVGLDG